MHNGFVDMGAEKMSKSLGNIVTPAELLEQDHRGEMFRLALLSAHYRQPLAWTDDVVVSTKAQLYGWYRFLEKFTGGLYPAHAVGYHVRSHPASSRH